MLQAGLAHHCRDLRDTESSGTATKSNMATFSQNYLCGDVLYQHESDSERRGQSCHPATLRRATGPLGRVRLRFRGPF